MRVRLDAETHDLVPTDDGWWSAEPRRGTGHRLRLPARRRRARPARPAVTLATARASTGRAGSTTRMPSAGTTKRGADGTLARRGRLRVAHRHVHRATAPSTPRSSGWTTSSTSASTHVELLPVNAFNGVWNWGYDGVAWYAVHEPYGGPDGLKRFVDACHARGLAVLLDVVYNHLGPSGNYLPRFGPYLSSRTQHVGRAASTSRPRLRPVRDYIIDNALHVAARLPRRRVCASTPCTRCVDTSTRPSAGRAVRAGRCSSPTRLGRPLTLSPSPT